MRVLISTLLLATPVTTFAHGGGLNSEGCHTNHKTGDYHCHRASSNQQQRKAVPQQGQEPVCHVGPRGGTYTVTPSGKKNYKVC